MAINHVNRQGDTYYLHQGKTKTGKPMFFFSKNQDGTLVEAIPEGYEIHEKPNAQVFLRKTQPRLVAEAEVALVEQGVGKHAGPGYLIDVKGKHIVVYENSMPILRFTLEDEEKRLFGVERWCFRGSIDDWVMLSGGDLKKMVAKYCPHLGKESFYELI